MKKGLANMLSIRVLAILFVTVIPAVTLLVAINTYAVVQVREEIFASNNDILTIYMEQIDFQLANARDYIHALDTNQVYIADFQSENEANAYYAANRYSTAIMSNITNYKQIQGFAVYTPTTGRSVYSFNPKVGYGLTDREAVLKHFQNVQADYPASLNKWRLSEIDHKYYLLYVYYVQETYFCVWTSVDTLIEPIREWDTALNSVVLLLSDNDTWDTADYAGAVSIGKLPETSDSLWVMERESAIGDFKLVVLLDAENIVAPFTRILYMAIVIFIVFLLCVPVVLRTLNRNVFNPLKSMSTGIAALDGGNLDYQIQESRTLNNEFRTLIRSFNNMTLQIKNYKVQSYKDEIERSKLELQFLQVQVEPHFYLNSLNTINAMAQIGDTALIVKLSKNLSDYMRYLAGSRMSLVPLDDELRHIENYVSILLTRLGDRFKLVMNIEPGTENTPIPPLLIQTLVENSTKHALDAYTQIVITVLVRREAQEGGVIIVVSDNGRGYPNEIIEAVNVHNEAMLGDRIGLLNAIKRLRYLVGGAADFTIGNSPGGGAWSRIKIPEREVQV